MRYNDFSLEIPGSKGSEGREFCNEPFKIERELSSLSPDERLIKRQEKSIPALEAFWCWLEKLHPMNNKKLSEAIKYAKNQRIYLEKFLLDGRIPISNNQVENAKANNLNVFQYLAYLFKNLPNINFKEQPELLAQYLPWSESLPKTCRMEGKKINEESTSL